MSTSQRRTARALVDRHGTTFAAEAGITLRDKPSPLWRLLVLTLLLSARIDAAIAVRSARELSKAGWRTPQRMRDSTWQQRVDALGRGGYRRYDEKTATQLDSLADAVGERWGGDLRRLHDDAGDDPGALSKRLQEFTGIGPTGAAIFVREAQAVWPALVPYVDAVAADGASRVGLPRDAEALCRLTDREDFASLVAGCVRAARSDEVVADVAGG